METKSYSRREFIQTTGSAALGAFLLGPEVATAATSRIAPMPTRPLGNTGAHVPILSFGGSLHLPLLMLRQAFKLGVTYWDTAHSYMGGDSETRIGKYLDKYPQDRPAIFLVTKSHAWTLAGMAAELEESLARMHTDYVDLFFVHSVSHIDELSADHKTWAEKQKAEGKIRLFGFSTHYNMDRCLFGAADLGWIDAVMMSYNFRLMHDDGMRRAVEACARAGIGLIAMKTQGGGSFKRNASQNQWHTDLLQNGFSEAQAKLKAVWENPLIASICSEMPNMKILMENVSAALDHRRLSDTERQGLRQYAQETRAGYCMGCARICEPAVDGDLPICDVMRALMYWRSYASRPRAIRTYMQLTADQRTRLAKADFTAAEHACPQKMPIGDLVQTALREFSV